jgi:hypothetical protein
MMSTNNRYCSIGFATVLLSYLLIEIRCSLEASFAHGTSQRASDESIHLN